MFNMHDYTYLICCWQYESLLSFFFIFVFCQNISCFNVSNIQENINYIAVSRRALIKSLSTNKSTWISRSKYLDFPSHLCDLTFLARPNPEGWFRGSFPPSSMSICHVFFIIYYVYIYTRLTIPQNGMDPPMRNRGADSIFEYPKRRLYKRNYGHAALFTLHFFHLKVRMLYGQPFLSQNSMAYLRQHIKQK